MKEVREITGFKKKDRGKALLLIYKKEGLRKTNLSYFIKIR